MRINHVYKSVNRPLTLLGVERRLFFFAAINGVATFNLMGSFLGGLLVFLALFLFAQWSTHNDPQMLRILLNSARYKPLYCPVKFKPVRVKRISHD
jgi:type IV secretory pathway TrbD component